jgi:hypothetical protein
MKKIFLFTVFVIFVTSYFVYAQQYEDVVYLKNGSIIRGTIIEQVLNESLKIRTKDGSVFVYNTDEISKITKEEITKIKKENKPTAPKQKLWLGFYGGLNFSNISISSPEQTSSGPDGVIKVMIGIFAERSWSKNFSSQAGLTYIGKGADKVYILGYYPCTVSADFLDLEVLLKGKLGMKGLDPYGLFGTYVGFKLSADAEHMGQSVNWSSHTSDIGLGLYLGAGTDISVGMKSAAFLELRYEFGMQNLNEDVGTSMVTSNGLKLLAGLKFDM